MAMLIVTITDLVRLFSLMRTHSRDFVFQQNVAPPHWSLQVRAFLNEEVPQRWICRKRAQDRAFFAWHPRFPDITPCDFYLWGYIKDNVYVVPLPTTLDDFRADNTQWIVVCCNAFGRSSPIALMWSVLQVVVILNICER